MIADLKPYAEYRSAGEWLGEIPAHWAVRRMKFVVRETYSRSTSGNEQLLRISQYTGVTRRRLADGFEEPDTRADSLVGYKRVEPDDLVINIMLAWNGSMGVSRYSGIVSPAYCVYRLGRDVHPWYFHNLLRSPAYKARIRTSSTGVVESRLRLYSDDLGRIEAMLPPLSEQAAIVRFLDWVNGRLERAIRAKRRVIALLNEQKQAIIHRAVTRGLDPSVPRKSSDSRWFPELPEKWEVLPMRRLILAAIDGPHFSPKYHDSGIPFLSARNVKAGRWSLEDAKFISEEDYREFCRRVRPEVGDVLYTKGGTTGVARAVDLEFPFQVWVHIAVLKLNHTRITPEFLAFCLNSPRCYVSFRQVCLKYSVDNC
jgi:type I restriction enzyme S subunit